MVCMGSSLLMVHVTKWIVHSCSYDKTAAGILLVMFMSRRIFVNTWASYRHFKILIYGRGYANPIDLISHSDQLENAVIYLKSELWAKRFNQKVSKSTSGNWIQCPKVPHSMAYTNSWYKLIGAGLRLLRVSLIVLKWSTMRNRLPYATNTWDMILKVRHKFDLGL